MLIEVKARELRPGDVLCTEETANHGFAPTAWTSRWNSYRLQSRALLIAWEHLADVGGLNHTGMRAALRVGSHRVESSSYGLFKARVVMHGGAVVRLPRNVTLAVYRKDAE